MIVIDAQLPPAIANWISDTFSLEAKALRDLGLRDADDIVIFNYARNNNCIVVTKDTDFVDLLQKHGAPPKIILLTCGNTSNIRLKEIFLKNLLTALKMLDGNEILIEIAD